MSKNTKIIITIIAILAAIALVFMLSQARVESPLENDNSNNNDGAGVATPLEEDKGTSTPNNPSPGPVSTTVVARLNQKVSMGGASGMVTEVLEDSRCPVDVQCIQAGTVRVRVNFSYGALDQNATLTLNQPYTVVGRTATLVGVKPEKRSDVPIKPSDYVFTILVK